MRTLVSISTGTNFWYKWLTRWYDEVDGFLQTKVNHFSVDIFKRNEVKL